MQPSIFRNDTSTDELGRDKSALRIYLLIGVVLLASRIIAGLACPIYDDAFITFTYARNLVAGNGFVYYPGEWILGTTSPLFGLVSSLFYFVRLPMPQSVVALNIALDLLVLYLTIAMVPRRVRPVFAVVFGAIFALSPIVARVCVGAMEANLFLACSVAAILLYLRRFRAAAFALATLSYLLRPEALLLLAILGFMQLRSGPKLQTVRMVVIAVVTLAAPLLLMYLLYGQILSQSVVAKSGADVALTTVWKGLLAAGPLLPALLVPALWGVLAARGSGSMRYANVVLVWTVLFVTAYSIARPMIWSWYGIAIYYGVVLWSAIGLIDVMGRLRLLQLARRLSPIICLIPVVAWAAILVVKGPSGVTQKMHDPVRVWCDENIKDPNTTMMASDIGVIGYYSRARMFDLNGLVWPGIAEYSSWDDAVRGVEPDYLFLNATTWTGRLMSDPDMAAHYTPVARFNLTGDSSLQVDMDRVPRSWVADYLMYRRNAPPSRSNTERK